MVKVASLVIKFPLASVKVNVTVAEPVDPHKSDSPVKLFVTVAVPDPSCPVKLFNQELSSFVLPFQSHSTVLFCGAFTQVGLVLSMTLTTLLHSDLHPFSSSADKVSVSVWL